MARVTAQAEINGFEGGLVTDRNPLDSVPNTTSSESNMPLNTDKSRSRRLGMDLEEGYTDVDSGVVLETGLGVLGRSSFNWKNAGGDEDKELLVVQIGGNLKVFDLDNEPVTSVTLYEEDFEGVYSNTFSYAVIDGLLVIATGLKTVSSYSYANGTITNSEETLLIRDSFKVEAVVDGVSLTDPRNFQIRPETITSEHLYNLRNSTFSSPRYNGNAEVLLDPIASFYEEASVFPSGGDNLLRFLYADTTDAGDRNTERFWPSGMKDTPASSEESPRGFFIIDALERGKSRIEQLALLQYNSPELEYASIFDFNGGGVTEIPLTSSTPNGLEELDYSSIPEDRTPDGASVITEHSGRIWYGGFSAEVVGGDSNSPKMSSYLLFSTLVKDPSDIGRCYQDADPTSAIDNAVVDTDGGFLRLDGAYGIRAMVSVATKLIVLAKNGIWVVSGGESDGFKATDFTVKRVSTNGINAPKSVVVVDDSVMYWGEESIYLMSLDQVTTNYSSKDMTTTIIKDFYLSIPLEDRKTCSGYFDKYTRKVYWVYSSEVGGAETSSQLVFNIDYGSFTPYDVDSYSGGYPQVVDINESQPFSSGDFEAEITSEGETVVIGEEVIVSTVSLREASTKETIYLVITGSSPTITYSVGAFTDQEFVDWSSLGGVDSGAYLTVNSVTGGTGRFEKQVPYLTMFFNRTEVGIDSDLEYINPSACLLSSHWGWSTGINSNKWTVPRQAYRITRPYSTSEGLFDNGESVLTTRNKVRGSGKSIAFKFEAESGKDMHIYGWSFNLNRTNQE